MDCRKEERARAKGPKVRKDQDMLSLSSFGLSLPIFSLFLLLVIRQSEDATWQPE